ncbi:ABC transporter ATP-binding protein [Brachyspira sp.]|uniref:ABC transporter ATP-binding protein n=1 Tax=Brachyspira sp. TaxID=1977261 RepID=UPI0026387F81|nr:ABC transporter ATP-binding protein [Brachyspira sp.]
MEILISAENIDKKFKKKQILKNINFNINKGEIIALVGPNGSGKTTLINILLGIIKPDSGKLKINIDNYKKHIGVQLQSTPFFEGYSVKDNILMFSALYGIKFNNKEIENMLDKYVLNADTPAIKLSGGEQKKLAIMIATMQNPDLLIFDEPTASLDPRERYNVKNMIYNLAKENKTILFTSHDLEEVEDMATRIVFLYKGEILENGNKEELLKKYNFDKLEKIYLHITNY